MKRAQKGFTLIEIMIVVAIIAILAAVAIPNFISYRKTSQANACKANLKSIETAAEAYEVSKSGQTIATVDISTDLVGTDGNGFLKAVPKCPAGGTYAVEKDETTGAWKATCTGAQPAHPAE